VAFTRLFEELGDFVDHLKIVPNFLHPAVGALGLGIVGFCFPCVLGSGYDTIEDILSAKPAKQSSGVGCWASCCWC
jgi:H+/Cl- antiporter ClcA